MQAVEAPRVMQLSYAPELNPVERFFRELRPAIEGRLHSGPADQAGYAGADPEVWQVDSVRVRQPCGWSWIREALTNLADALYYEYQAELRREGLI